MIRFFNDFCSLAWSLGEVDIENEVVPGII